MKHGVIRSGNVVLTGAEGRPFLAELFLPAEAGNFPVVVFSHGFKGFKDWGAFPQLAEYFAAQGFACVLFSFSHNGTTPETPFDFADPEAFGQNNFIKELTDLGVVLDWITQAETAWKNQLQPEQIYLVGHSRGGGISMLKAREDSRVKAVSVWGSVNEFGRYWKQNEREKLERDGVVYIPNVRTGQMLPIYRQLYDNYEANRERLFIPDAVKQLGKSLQIIHGAADETVPVQSALDMKSWNAEAELYLVTDGNHTFGMKHPWQEASLPEALQQVCAATIQFFEKAKTDS